MVNNDNLVNKLRTVAYYSPYDHNSGNPYWSTGSIGLGTSNMAGRINLSNGQNTNTRIVLGPSTSSTNLDYCSIIESNNTGSLNYGSDLRFYTHSTTTSTTSTERMRIDANGNIGIGTNLPSYKLDILGTTNVTRIKSNQNAVSLLLEDGTTNLSFITSSRFGTLTNGWITIDPNGGTPSGVGFWDNIALSGQMTIGGSYASTAAPSNGLIVQGQVGIGTSSPTGSLNLIVGSQGSGLITQDPTNASKTSIEVRLRDTNTGANYFTCDQYADVLNNSSYQSTRFIIKQSGNVGIGTSTPGQLLHVNGGRIRIEGSNGVLEIKTSTYVSYIFTESNGDLKLYPASTGQHIILNPNTLGGNVGIGNSSPSAKLSIGTVNSTDTALLIGYNTNPGTQGGGLFYGPSIDLYTPG